MDRFSPNFVYAFILSRSTLRSLQVIFRKFAPEFWPLIYSKILFPLNITFRTRVMVLDLCQNFVSVQYLENKWTDSELSLTANLQS